jgi:hypothetical protein
MIQPNVYWTLDTPFATLIGLYTNVPSGGVIDAEQEDWFRKEMKSAPPEKALIVMMNHPPYSVDEHHSGSVRMSDALEGAIRYSGREPDAVFSADVFNYQRFTLRRSGRDSLYFVAGVGGYYHLHHLSKVTIPDASLGEKGLTLESAYVQHGFVQVTVSSTQLVVRYLAVEKSGSSSTSDVRDSVVFDLHRHVVISSGAR